MFVNTVRRRGWYGNTQQSLEWLTMVMCSELFANPSSLHVYVRENSHGECIICDSIVRRKTTCHKR
jgi:hypothetical protein